MKTNKLKVIKSKATGETWIELVAPNGRVLLNSQLYSDRRSVDRIVDILENYNYEIIEAESKF